MNFYLVPLVSMRKASYFDCSFLKDPTIFLASCKSTFVLENCGISNVRKLFSQLDTIRSFRSSNCPWKFVVRNVKILFDVVSLSSLFRLSPCMANCFINSDTIVTGTRGILNRKQKLPLSASINATATRVIEFYSRTDKYRANGPLHLLCIVNANDSECQKGRTLTE